MRALHKFAEGLIRLSAIVGTLGLLFVVAVIVIDVVGRNFGQPLYGAQDLVMMTMVIVVFGGMALCGREDGHIVVDILEPRMSPRLNRTIDLIAGLLGATIFVLIAYTVFKSAQLSQMLNLSSNLLRLPTAWFQYALCALSLVAALALILRALITPRRPHPEQKTS